MKNRSYFFLASLVIGLLLLTFGKFKGESLREKSLPFFSNYWMLADRWWRGELAKDESLTQENRLLKKALREIADGEEVEPLSIQGRVKAKVIYRPLNEWLSSFWIDLGEENGGGLIGFHSPVLYRGALLGLIDYVGQKQSRVLLITDPKLRPAVRVARGDKERFMISDQIDHLQNLLKIDPPPSNFLDMLSSLKEHYLPEGNRWLLAKGELRGATSPLYAGGPLLKGVGFNLETEDRQGPARDLRTGIPYNDPQGRPIPLIQLYDLLVTSGLDGLFPEGIDVALVTFVGELDEGDVAFEIQAEPLFGAMEEIRDVEVLPPVPFDPSDLPPLPLQKRSLK